MAPDIADQQAVVGQCLANDVERARDGKRRGLEVIARNVPQNPPLDRLIPSMVERKRRGAELRGERRDSCRDVADRFNRSLIAAIDLRRCGIDVDDRFVAVWVPPVRRIFCNVVADGEYEVGSGYSFADEIAKSGADREQRLWRAIRYRPLAHEGRYHRDAVLLGKPGQGAAPA